MQIDILSQNTLKLTLSRLDMFDLDIKYESLSGKNPETKRLLSHVLKSIQLDKRIGFDFSGERLFVEAFPRPDGGCMLYISSLENESFSKKQRKTVFENPSDIHPNNRQTGAKNSRSTSVKEGAFPYCRICEINSINNLKGLCNSLVWLKNAKKLSFDSALYNNSKKYRLVLECNNLKLAGTVLGEYGTVLDSEFELINTVEHFKEIKTADAVETLAGCL